MPCFRPVGGVSVIRSRLFSGMPCPRVAGAARVTRNTLWRLVSTASSRSLSVVSVVSVGGRWGLPPLLASGVVDEDVDRAVPDGGGAYDGVHLLGGADVATPPAGVGTLFALEFGGHGDGVPRAEEDPQAVPAERAGHGEAEARLPGGTVLGLDLSDKPALTEPWLTAPAGDQSNPGYLTGPAPGAPSVRRRHRRWPPV